MMTAAELATIIQGITPVIREHVRSAIAEATVPLLERTASLEAQIKAFEPVRHGRDGVDGKHGIDGKDGAPGANGKDGRDGRDGLPGQPGERGKDGRDGIVGKDGVDGLGFDDLSVEPNGERIFVLKFQRGDRIKAYPLTFDVPLYQGIYQAGTNYKRGDAVTYAGCCWIAQADTDAKPSEADTPWRLAVKAGRDGKAGQTGENGKDGKDGKDGLSWR